MMEKCDESQVMLPEPEQAIRFFGRARRILFNVSGQKFEVTEELVLSHPSSLLASLKPFLPPGPEDPQPEFFFDRNPDVFSAVLDYYRTGELHAPAGVCGGLLGLELEAWGLQLSQLAPCCRSQAVAALGCSDEFKKVESLGRSPVSLKDIEKMRGWRRTQWHGWQFLNYPMSSKLAMVYAVFSFLVVMASITNLYAQSYMDHTERMKNATQTNSSATRALVSNSTNATNQPRDASNKESGDNKDKELKASEYFELVCTVYFTLEVLVRIIFAPSKLDYVKDFLNWVDILALIPYYVELVMISKHEELRGGAFHTVIIFFRVLRVLRIFHLFKCYSPLKVLTVSIMSSVRELIMLVLFFLTLLFVFGSLIYYAEMRQTGTEFHHMFAGLWWAFITMTTIGYGDMVPKTWLGMCITSLVGISGILVIACTLAPVAANFNTYFSHFRSAEFIQIHAENSSKRKKSGNLGVLTVYVSNGAATQDGNAAHLNSSGHH